jgi:hypothetical protein
MGIGGISLDQGNTLIGIGGISIDQGNTLIGIGGISIDQGNTFICYSRGISVYWGKFLILTLVAE